jgi:diguanylate cyclase (GGDEF)-like protein
VAAGEVVSCTADPGTGGAAAVAPAGLVGQAVPVRVGDDVLATAVVVVSADGVLAGGRAAVGAPAGVELAVVDPRVADPADAVVAATGPGPASPELAPEVTDAARWAAAGAARPGGADGIVTAEPAGRVLAARALPAGGVVVAVAERPGPGAAWPLAGVLVLVVAALAGAVALATVTLTRGVTGLAEVARRLAARSAGPRGAAASDLVADLRDLARAPEPEVRRVTTTIDDLLRLAQESEAGAARATASAVGAFGSFGAALERAPEQEGLLRSVAEAALLAADARLAVVSFTAASAPGTGPDEAVADAGGERTVAVFLAGGAAWSRQDGTPVLLTGDPDGIDLTDPDDLAAATTGLRLLRDLAAHAVATGRAVSAELPGEGSGVVAPLRTPAGLDGPGGVAGYVAVARDAGSPALEPGALGQLSTLARHAGAALLNVRRHHLASRQSITDPLTGIGNLRLLTQTLGREVERAARFGHSLSVLMLDLDHFKAVNDTHGHARGDLVLTELARRLARCVRDIDTVARYGGEEFCLVLPETSPEGAEVVARRVLAAVSGEPFPAPGGPPLHVTVSVGVAAYPEHGRTGGEVMRAADRALYAAKRTGRDKVVVAAGAETPAPAQAPAPAPAPAPPVPPQTPRNQGVVRAAHDSPVHLG